MYNTTVRWLIRRKIESAPFFNIVINISYAGSGGAVSRTSTSGV